MQRISFLLTALVPVMAAISPSVAQGSETVLIPIKIALGDIIERHATNRNGTRLQIGVVYTNKCVADAVSFKNADFVDALSFERCDFLGEVDFSFARFQRRVALRYCVFQEHVSLDGMEVEKDLDLTGSVFLKGLSMEKTHIVGRLLAQGIVVNGSAEFAESRIDLTADFGLAYRTNIGLSALNLKQRQTLTSGIVRDAVLKSQGLDEATTAEVTTLLPSNALPTNGPPEYCWLIYGKTNRPPFFYAVWKKCYGSDDCSLEVHRQTAFLGPVDMAGVRCGSKLLLGSANFWDHARFDGIKAEGTVYLAGAHFFKFCSFGYAQIAEDLDATDVHFSESCNANFHGMRARQINLSHASFGSRIDFGEATASVSFEAWQARFRSSNDLANFQGLKVAGDALFNEAQFEGPVSFALAAIGGNFDVKLAQFRCSAPRQSLATIAAPNPIHFHADFDRMRVEGFAILSRASFSGLVSLRNASFQQLHLDLSSNRTDLFASSQGKNSLFLEGCAFKRIRAMTNESTGDDSGQLEESWHRLRDVLREHAAYSPHFYQAIEDSFQAEGQTELANDVYIESRRREWNELSLLGKMGSKFLDVTMSYGRNPWRAVICSLVVMLAGMIFFRTDNMIETATGRPASAAKTSNELRYRAFLYSLDLFLPIIPLEASDRWEPAKEHWGIWWYGRLHTFLGWVLTPIALTASTGVGKLTDYLQYIQ